MMVSVVRRWRSRSAGQVRAGPGDRVRIRQDAKGAPRVRIRQDAKGAPRVRIRQDAKGAP
jgi:hypothetical protein